jgi:hypothetical protein
VQPAKHFKRIVFLGRLETRKGLELFVDGLVRLQQSNESCLEHIGEVVLLGKEGHHAYGGSMEAADRLKRALDRRVEAFTGMDTHDAQAYLSERVADSLVVMPSLVDNMPYAVIEGSLIPGLNLICSSYGGMPEVLGPSGDSQLFEPFVVPLAKKLEEWLQRGPVASSELGHYDWRRHNRLWLDFHEEASGSARKIAQGTAPRQSPSGAGVDVCIPYFNKGRYLPQLLAALEHQSTQGFTVTVVNDASTDEESVRTFEEMAKLYEPRGWTFISNEENRGLSATRNLAASQGSGKYVVFVDADNVPALDMISRFRTSIERSGDDCLTSYMDAFRGDGPTVRDTE